MPDILIPDFSFWQGAMPDSSFSAFQAGILRATFSTVPDTEFARDVGQAIRFWRVIGCYGYMVAGADAAVQGRALGVVIRDSGLPTSGRVWFAVCDAEEGTGDQSARVAAFLDGVHEVLSEAATQDWTYSGLNFMAAHLQHAPGLKWVAAYGPSEPSLGHVLWQETDAYRLPDGQAVDCSVFHGSIADLASLITGSDPVDPAQEDDMGIAAAQFGPWQVVAPPPDSATSCHVRSWQPGDQGYRDLDISQGGRPGATPTLIVRPDPADAAKTQLHYYAAAAGPDENAIVHGWLDEGSDPSVLGPGGWQVGAA